MVALTITNTVAPTYEYPQGGFYRMITAPAGAAADGTFPPSTITSALSRGEALVFRYAHQWSPGAAAVADAIATSFRRRSNINVYVVCS